jgi:Protein of unknown function (DUF2752)
MTAARRIPWVALGLVLAGASAWVLSPMVRAHPGLLRPCLFKTLTGLPCVTCGLTRSFLALLDGHPVEAFHWHPVAVLLVALSPLLAAWDVRRAMKGGAYPALPQRLAPRLALAVLLAGTWILQIVRGI